MKPQAFDIIAACLRNGSGLVIGPEKLYLLEARLGRILKQQGLRPGCPGRAARGR